MKPEDLTDVRYEVDRGLAWITIDRPERYNAFRGRTIDELIRCFKAAWTDHSVGVVALTGAGDKAFCAGGDQKQRSETGDYGPTETGLFEVETLHRVIRDVPKPVIAAVNGVAIGGGHVFHATVLDDYSRFIVAWRLCTAMAASDVSATLEEALAFSELEQVRVVHRPRRREYRGRAVSAR